MTNEKLAIATDLSAKITDLEKMIESGKTQRCTWIEFTFGNGGNKANVCNDPVVIELVRSLIVKENELKLEQLKKEFAEL